MMMLNDGAIFNVRGRDDFVGLSASARRREIFSRAR